jgi:hypothetical protein
LARYSDGQLGASKDEPFPNAYRYRDWVIRSLNEDMPYDLFVKAQIAGDLLPSDDPQKLIPGLVLCAGAGEDDRVDVTGQVFLGLTWDARAVTTISTIPFQQGFLFASGRVQEFRQAPVSAG